MLVLLSLLSLDVNVAHRNGGEKSGGTMDLGLCMDLAWTMDINLTRNRPANNNNYEDYLPNNNHKVLNLYYSQHHHHYYCYLRLAN